MLPPALPPQPSAPLSVREDALATPRIIVQIAVPVIVLVVVLGLAALLCCWCRKQGIQLRKKPLVKKFPASSLSLPGSLSTKAVSAMDELDEDGVSRDPLPLPVLRKWTPPFAVHTQYSNVLTESISCREDIGMSARESLSEVSDGPLSPPAPPTYPAAAGTSEERLVRVEQVPAGRILGEPLRASADPYLQTRSKQFAAAFAWLSRAEEESSGGRRNSQEMGPNTDPKTRARIQPFTNDSLRI